MRTIYIHKDKRKLELKENYDIMGIFYLLDVNNQRIKKGFGFEVVLCYFKNLKEVKNG